MAVSGSLFSKDTTVAHIPKPLSDCQKNIGLIQYLLHLLGTHATLIPHIMPTHREWGKLELGAGLQHSVVAKPQ